MANSEICILYSTIPLPPSSTGGVQYTVALLLPKVPLKLSGGDGTPNNKTGLAVAGLLQ